MSSTDVGKKHQALVAIFNVTNMSAQFRQSRRCSLIQEMDA